MTPPPPPPPPPRPPTFLDHVERLLLRVILVALLVLAITIGFAVWQTRGRGVPPAAALPPAGTGAVTLVIDYADGTQRRFTDLPASPGMTVLDAMNLAAAHARPLSFVATGTGDTVFLSRIDDLPNEPTGAGWQYWINAEYGLASIGVAKLRPGDRLTWAFRAYQRDPAPPGP